MLTELDVAVPWPIRQERVKAEVFAILTALPDDEALTTAELARRICAKPPQTLFNALMRIAPTMAVRMPPEVATTGPLKGKEVRRSLWRRLDPAALPAPEPKTSSLVERVSQLERRVAALEEKPGRQVS